MLSSGPRLTTQADIEKYKPSAASSSSSTSAAAKSPSSGSSALPGKPAPSAPAEYEDIPVTNMRKTIGKRLTESKQTLPHYYLTVEVNMGKSQGFTRHACLSKSNKIRPRHEAEGDVQQGWRGKD
jgi:pyruvate/2-oxoglutarate dehydrogenase complex dihydrolipoamide acyltransferase (E2) component